MLVPLAVADVMSSPVETVPLDRSVAEVARRLRAAGVGSLVVCEGEDPVGIVTEADLVGVLARDGDADGLRVREVMSTELVTVGPDAALEEAARLLAANGVRRLPVRDGDELVGIVTTTDLSYYLPHLSRPKRAWRDRVDTLASSSPSTAYDAPGWTVEREGGAPLSVGDAVRFTKTLSEADVEAFAEASGDTNRLHLDPDFAAVTQFGGPIVHGLLAAGLVSAALARLPGLTVYLSQDLRFLGPVAVGETATAVCEVVADLGGDRYELTTTVYGADGDPVVDGDAVVSVTDLPAGADTDAGNTAIEVESGAESDAGAGKTGGEEATD